VHTNLPKQLPGPPPSSPLTASMFLRDNDDWVTKVNKKSRLPKPTSKDSPTHHGDVSERGQSTHKRKGSDERKAWGDQMEEGEGRTKPPPKQSRGGSNGGTEGQGVHQPAPLRPVS
jgi:hypothetical protein